MRVCFETLGCRSNAFDSELMANHFRSWGYTVVGKDEMADVYVINTCTVTSEADRSSRQAIYRAKRKNPNAIVVATGCYAQVNPQALKDMKEVDLIVGNSNKHRIVEILEDYMQGNGQDVLVENIFLQSSLQSFDLITFYEKSRPFVKIQEGCNRFCSFCVIPYARGKVRSVPEEKVLREVELLAQKGFQEVVLTGTQLTQYGWDRGTDLYELLRKLLKVNGIELIRLSSMHPSEIGTELLELIASEEKIAPHFHLSLQSGSDRILKLMERNYTTSEYVELVEKIINRRPLTAIGTDIIAGFPSETEEDFWQTYKLVEELPLAYMHVFPYSDRPFTKASKMKEKLPARFKEERVKLLRALDERKRKDFALINSGRRLRATIIEHNRLLTENYINLVREGFEAVGKVVTLTI